MSYINELKKAIRRLHRSEADHIETVPVTEVFQDQIVWQGEVEVFNIHGHPKARRCYAWSYKTDNGGKRYMAVLELPPVDSAQTAVKAAIVSDIKSNANQKGK
jgi:hypothetical protein